MGLKDIITVGASLLTGRSRAPQETFLWQNPTQYEELDPQSPLYARAMKALARAVRGDASVFYKLGNVAFGYVTKAPRFFACDAGYITQYFAIVFDERRDRALKLPNADLYEQFVAIVQSDHLALTTDTITSTLRLTGLGSYGHITQKELDDMSESAKRDLFAPKLLLKENSTIQLEYCKFSHSPMTRPVPTVCTLTCAPHEPPKLQCRTLDNA